MIELRHLSVKYNDTDNALALSDISLRFENGENVALIGANGAGKTTLLLSMLGLLKVSSGDIYMDEIKLSDKTQSLFMENIGMVFQNPDNQLFMPTVYEDVGFGISKKNTGIQERDRRIEDILKELGISHLKERHTDRLSGGEKRLAALAGVLVMKPTNILLDEPAAFLDPASKRRLLGILKNLKQGLIIATHDMDIASMLCDRVVFLKQGKIFASDTTDKILSNKELLLDGGL